MTSNGIKLNHYVPGLQTSQTGCHTMGAHLSQLLSYTVSRWLFHKISFTNAFKNGLKQTKAAMRSLTSY